MKYQKYLKKITRNVKLNVVFLFFIGMAVMTVIARMADAFMIPQVTAASLEEKKLEYPMEVEGQIKAKGVRAVYCKENLRVENVFVQQNDMIKKGDLLFSIEKENLSLQIQTMEQEISKCDLQIEDLQNTYREQVAQKNQNLKRAKEDYNDILNATKNVVDTAYMEMENARTELEQHDSEKPEEIEEQKEVVQSLRSLEEESEKAEQENIRQPEKLQKIEKESSEKEYAEQKEKSKKIHDSMIKREEENIGEKEKILKERKGQEILFAEWTQKRAELEQKYYEKQKNYEDAILSRQEALKSASRQMEDADQKVTKNNSIILLQMEKENLEHDRKELFDLYQAEGKVYAEFDGRISECKIKVGSTTTSEPVMLLEDFNSSFQFEGTIEESTDFYAEEGMECTIEIKSENILLEGVKISEVTEKEQGIYRITAEINLDSPPKVGKAVLRVTKKSKRYANCIPASALYTQAAGNYIIRVKEDVTILGVQAVAEYVPVTLLEKNDTYAAVDGNLSSSDKIIVNASKEIKEGERIRMIEE